MLAIINLIFGCFLNITLLIYMTSSLLKSKYNYKSKKYILTVLLMTLYWSVSYAITNNMVRILISFLLLIVACLILFKQLINKSILSSFISMLTLLIAEITYVLFNVIIFNFDEIGIQNNVFGTFITNTSILIIALVIFKLINRKNRISNLIEKINYKDKNSNLYIVFLAFTTIIMLIYCIYFDTDLLLVLIFGIIIIIIYVIFTINLIKEKVDNYKLKKENEDMISSLTEYEKMYVHQRMKNHEYKNDLSILRGMLNKEDKKALNYIDEIIDLKSNEKHSWMELLKKIPEGGLRGILYYKFSEMENLNINIEFIVSKNYKPTNYIKLEEQLKYKICKLLGIYLDNAKQALENIEEKNIYMEIIENKKNLTFKIANKFIGQFDIENISELGYTTKGKGHGYGLSIAKEIIDKEEKIENKIQIIKDKFIQEIIVKKI